MQSPSSKRRQFIKRVVAYFLMTISVIVLSTVLVLLMLGYRFNRYSGTFQQGGLVQFISQPSGASVTVGDIQLQNKTRSKITLNPGDYLVKMQRPGYQTWQKNVTVKAGTVLWLNSAHLVPNDPQTDQVLELPTLASTSSRSGNDEFALLQSASKPAITLARIDGDSVKTRTITLESGSYHAAKTHRFTLADWLDDHHLLVKHAYAKSQEWIVVDTDHPSKSRQIAATDDSYPLKVIADPRSSGRVLVLWNDGTVTVDDLSSEKETTLPLSGIAEMSTDDDVLLYATEPAKGRVSTGYLTLGKAAPRTIASYPSKEPVHIAGGEYFDVHHLATTVGKTVTIVKTDDLPSSDSQDPLRTETVKTLSLSDEATRVDFKAQGRFIVVQQPLSQTTYDLELDVQSDVPIVGAKRAQSSALVWLDNFHFWSDTDGFMRQYEFDGTNQTDIVTVAPGFSAVYSPNQKYLYTIGKTAAGYQLQRTRMIL